MELLKKLFGRKAPAVVDSEKERRRLAGLLATEIRLYNASALAEMSAAAEPPAWFRKEVSRSYKTFVKSCGDSPDATAIFEAETARALTDGDVELVRAVLARADAQ
ncbi:MAG: hypothetical protein GY719_19670 [bacterium]|nr:hypothetical protein [bacterium]